jgi:hypothetical protein
VVEPPAFLLPWVFANDWLSRTGWRPNRGKRSGASTPGWIGHVPQARGGCWRGRAAPIVVWMAGQAGWARPACPSRPMLRSSTAVHKGSAPISRLTVAGP